jgi:hypothetical protein
MSNGGGIVTWLSGWGKRRKLTLDSFRVDEDLTDFPVLITLSSGTGKNDADVTNIFDELVVSNSTGLVDAFSGTSLDGVVWDTFLQPNATVTVSDELQLNNQTGSAHSGASCFTKEYFNKIGLIKLICKWKPHKDHYASAISPSIKFCRPDAARDVQYGSRNEQFVRISLGAQADTTDRTLLEIGDAGTAAGSTTGTLRNSASIAIDETQWHDLEITIDSEIKLCTVDLDGGTCNFSAYIDSTSWASIGSQFVLEFNSPDYNKNNTERFKDVVLSITEYTDNTKKIMITNSESVPCCTEVERWDWVNEQANLWIKVPTDKTQGDNTHYIGHTGEEAAKNVWDDDFVGVWHMAQDPSGGTGAIKDSTNSVNCTAGGSMTVENLVDGQIGKSLNFSSDYLTPGSEVYSLDFTIEAIVNPDSFLTADEGKNTIFNSGRNHGILQLRGDAGNAGKAALLITVSATPTYYYSSNTVSLGAWSYLAGRYSESLQNLKLHINTLLEIDQSVNGDSPSAGGNAGIGAQVYAGPNRYVDGQIDEVRVSQIARPDAWIKATYYSNWDDFITFGAEEEEPVYYLDGFVKKNNQPVSRGVKLYRRDTGALVGYDTSRTSDGYYYLTTPSSGTHFIVAFDDDAGEEFNALILDKVSIKGTV